MSSIVPQSGILKKSTGSSLDKLRKEALSDHDGNEVIINLDEHLLTNQIMPNDSMTSYFSKNKLTQPFIQKAPSTPWKPKVL